MSAALARLRSRRPVAGQAGRRAGLVGPGGCVSLVGQGLLRPRPTPFAGAFTNGSRTRDSRILGPMLFPLSYGVVPAFVRRFEPVDGTRCGQRIRRATQRRTPSGTEGRFPRGSQGDRWESNPQPQGPHPCALPCLSYGHTDDGWNRTSVDGDCSPAPCRSATSSTARSPGFLPPLALAHAMGLHAATVAPRQHAGQGLNLSLPALEAGVPPLELPARQSAWKDSNLRPRAPEARALPNCATRWVVSAPGGNRTLADRSKGGCPGR